MTEFLVQMRRQAQRRADDILANVGERAMRAAAEAAPPPVLPDFSEVGFNVIAEIKRRSPSAGWLASRGSSLSIAERAAEYAAAGAGAISVLTEPNAFGGSLDDLATAARTVGIPVMRKDFLVHPIQVLEARAAGASGVLIILRLLNHALLRQMLEAAQATGMFVLIEAFDAHDLDLAARLLAREPDVTALVGLNCRDLMTLEVDSGRFEHLAPAFPQSVPRVAESGVGSDEDVRRLVRAGYGVALVGEALMSAVDPGDVLSNMIATGRLEAATCASA